MDRRFAPLLVLLAAVTSIDLAVAATHCGPDSGANPAPMSTVVSSASTRSSADAVAATSETVPAKAPAPAAKVASTGGGSNPMTAGGGSAAGNEEGVLGDGGAPAGAHKRGLRWQSFLPGMIR